jgi:hypothetical protein
MRKLTGWIMVVLGIVIEFLSCTVVGDSWIEVSMVIIATLFVAGLLFIGLWRIID